MEVGEEVVHHHQKKGDSTLNDKDGHLDLPETPELSDLRKQLSGLEAQFHALFVDDHDEHHTDDKGAILSETDPFSNSERQSDAMSTLDSILTDFDDHDFQSHVVGPSLTEGPSKPILDSTLDCILPNPSQRSWIVIRRFGKRGGKKVQIPSTIFDLKVEASEKFHVNVTSLRESETEAEIEDIAAIKPDSIVLVLTEEDEKHFT